VVEPITGMDVLQFRPIKDDFVPEVAGSNPAPATRNRR
jgi:hypothetical protein